VTFSLEGCGIHSTIIDERAISLQHQFGSKEFNGFKGVTHLPVRGRDMWQQLVFARFRTGACAIGIGVPRHHVLLLAHVVADHTRNSLRRGHGDAG